MKLVKSTLQEIRQNISVSFFVSLLFFNIKQSDSKTHSVYNLVVFYVCIVHYLTSDYCITDLDQPTSIALDPMLGHMFWADAGSKPKIETAWLDSSRRRILVQDKVRQPTGLCIDFAQDHRVYWADTKLNVIEVMKPDGSNRNIVLHGTVPGFLSI